MSEAPSPSLVASVRQRRLNGARERGEELQLTLTRDSIERLQYRLSLSPRRHDFILQGAVLFFVWPKETPDMVYRLVSHPTRDLGFLGAGAPPLEAMTSVFTDIATTNCVKLRVRVRPVASITNWDALPTGTLWRMLRRCRE